MCLRRIALESPCPARHNSRPFTTRWADAHMFGFSMIFGIVFVIVFVMIIGGMIMQSVLFGSIFFTVTKGISQQLNQQAADRLAQRNASQCAFCGAARAADHAPCPACGAPQQQELPATRSPSSMSPAVGDIDTTNHGPMS